MPPEIRKDLREALRESGERVRKDSETKTSGVLASPKSGAGYRVVVRARGVNVEQSLRKTTGLRPDWGKAQMRRSLIPSLEENEQHIVGDALKATGQIEDFFELQARWRGSGLLL